MAKKKLYIAYGSNLNLRQMSRRCPDSSVAGKSVLEGYRLLFRGSDGCAVATIEEYAGGKVPVLVWEITAEDEGRLDRYEGYPYLYRKETIKVVLEGEEIKAMVYVMNPGRPLGEPNPYYYNTILEGYIDAGFDREVLDKAVRDSVEGYGKEEALC